MAMKRSGPSRGAIEKLAKTNLTFLKMDSWLVQAELAYERR